MKKLVLLVACATVLFSCDYLGGKKEAQLQAQNDSLLSELSNKNAEWDEMIASFNSIQEGFRLINEAEGRVHAQRELGASNAALIQEDMQFIIETMKRNREQIADLQEKLKNSNYNSTQMKKNIEGLTRQLVEKTTQLEQLRTELESKSIRIAELDDVVSGLQTDVKNLETENAIKERTLDAQDKALNAAWFVYGTKSELKEQRILKNGDVLQSNDFNKDYFTQIDIRKDKEIKLYSNRAKLLTTHPDGSYLLAKDSKGQYVLRITNPTEFWSVSRYLVIQVK